MSGASVDINMRTVVEKKDEKKEAEEEEENDRKYGWMEQEGENTRLARLRKLLCQATVIINMRTRLARRTRKRRRRRRKRIVGNMRGWR